MTGDMGITRICTTLSTDGGICFFVALQTNHDLAAAKSENVCQTRKNKCRRLGWERSTVFPIAD